MDARLHGYYRSSASYRVRLALNLKRIPYATVSHHLLHGDQRKAEFLGLNPQGLVPALELGDGTVLTQSLAIVEYLDERFPEPPLLPPTPFERARVRAFAQVLACDTHPLQNLRILRRVKTLTGSAEQAQQWARDIIVEGLQACEALLADQPGPFCFGGAPGLADIVLVPQLYNARRFGVELAGFPKLLRAEAACLALPAFAAAVPERQADAE